MEKTKILRELFKKEGVIRIAGAHDGLTAKLVEKAGFDGVWASGLEICTSFGVPDANILTMTQFLDRAIEMEDATSIPVVADCDTGFGNSNNVIQMVKKYQAAGIAAVCIEDKLFPKTNSLFKGRQELTSIAEFVGKIMAAKNAQRDENFMVIARVEALIVGWGLEEALKRANAYVDAGADAILIHSKSSTPQEIVTFVKSWKNRAPLVVVPTTYPSLGIKEIYELGIKMVIYANHGIRAAIRAVSNVFSEIVSLGTTESIEDKIVPMTEVFDLQGMYKMKKDEEQFFKTKNSGVVTVIPAAGDHLEEPSMRAISSDIPIAMLDLNGKTLLQRQVETLNRVGVVDVYVVGGYKRELISVEGAKVIENDRYSQTGILGSVMCARSYFKERVLIIYGDILFDETIVERVLKTEEDIVLLVDESFGMRHYGPERAIDYVVLDGLSPKRRRRFSSVTLGRVVKIGSNIIASDAHYEFFGIMVLSNKGVEIFKDTFLKRENQRKGGDYCSAPSFEKAGLSGIIQEIIDTGFPVHCLVVDAGWIELHSLEDYKLAISMIK